MLSLNEKLSDRGLTFTLTSDLSCVASILFANVNFSRKLRGTGNQPLHRRGQNQSGYNSVSTHNYVKHAQHNRSA